MNGWLKLHRKLLNWEWYKDSHMVHLFIHLLLEANHEDKKWRGIPVKRGQLITGRKSLSESTGIPEGSIRTCLKRLKSTNEVTIKSTSKFSIITICNYAAYQIAVTESDQQTNQQTDQLSTSKRPANDHYQEYKELKKNKDASPGRKFIPPTLEQIIVYCRERGNQIDPEHFLSYYTANGWVQAKGKPLKDWKATIITWEKNGFTSNHRILKNEPQRQKPQLITIIQ